MLLYNLIEWWGGILPWDREFASPQIAKLAKFRAFANPLKFLRWLHLLMCHHGEWRTEGGEGNTVGRWSYPPEHLTAMNVQEPSSILLKISKVIIFIYASSWTVANLREGRVIHTSQLGRGGHTPLSTWHPCMFTRAFANPLQLLGDYYIISTNSASWTVALYYFSGGFWMDNYIFPKTFC